MILSALDAEEINTVGHLVARLDHDDGPAVYRCHSAVRLAAVNIHDLDFAITVKVHRRRIRRAVLFSLVYNHRVVADCISDPLISIGIRAGSLRISQLWRHIKAICIDAEVELIRMGMRGLIAPVIHPEIGLRIHSSEISRGIIIA